MTQLGFYFDSTRCMGCRTCETACKDYYDTEVDTNYRKVYDCEGGSCSLNQDGTVENLAYSYHMSLGCNHCDDPACTKACPTGAIHRDEQAGLVLIDDTKCIGCGYCEMACPYNAPKVDRTKGHSVKCSGCHERLQEGKEPICVSACPLRALQFGQISDLERDYSDSEVGDIAPLPNKDITHPNLLVKVCPDAKPSGDMSVRVSNPLEVI